MVDSLSFDPYHKWLGIGDSASPPNHYRLLGIDLYESDEDVIAAAADRQMSHVRKYQSGPHAAVSQRVLNEIAKAKICLLNDASRTVYDRSLQAEQPDLGIKIVAAPPRHRQARPRRVTQMALVAAFALLAFVVGSYQYQAKFGSVQTTGPVIDSREHSPADQDLRPADSHVDSPATVSQSNEDRSHAGPDAAMSVPPIPRPIPREDQGTKPLQISVGANEPGAATQSVTERPHLPRIGKPSEKALSGPEVNEGRLPVPNGAELVEAERQVDRLFHKHGIRRPWPIDALGALVDSESATASPAMRYCLMNRQLQAAATAQDLERTWELASRIPAEFLVDRVKTKEHALDQLLRNTTEGVSLGRLLNLTHDEIWEAVREFDFSAARMFSAKLVAIAKRTKDRPTLKWARGMPVVVTSVEEKWKQLVRESEAVVAGTATPAQKGALGRFHCFTINDFKVGLPYLAECESEQLRSLARREITSRSPSKRKEIADDWWELSLARSGWSKTHLREHAAEIYQRILPKLNRQERSDALKKMAEFAFDTARNSSLVLLVGSVWRVDWEAHPPWDEIVFNANGHCSVVSQKRRLNYVWELTPTYVVVHSEDGTRSFRLTPVSDQRLNCEKFNSATGKRMCGGSAVRMR